MPIPGDCAPAELLAVLEEALRTDSCRGLVLSEPQPGMDGPGKLNLRPVLLSGERRFQLAERRGKQEFHRNVDAAAVLTLVGGLLGARFRQGALFTATADFAVRWLRADTVRVVVNPPTKEAPPLAHDRRKNHLIPEGQPCAFLAEIGVMSATGQVKAAKQAKFRQINRFLEFVADLMPELPAEGVLRIVDFGCGKSYLTFALHHFLTVLHRRSVDITGLDLKEDVVRDCQRIASRLGCTGLRFAVGDIAGFAAPGPVDLTVSLHACDTATDAALAQAIRWRSRAILAVPCCQHELSRLLPPTAMPGLLRHGILKERFAADATDALRASLLEASGYRTQIVEFIELEHTPKNLLLRAIRGTTPAPGADAAYTQLKADLGIAGFALDRMLQLPGG